LGSDTARSRHREVAIGGDQGQIANRRLEDEGRGVGGASRQGGVYAAARGGLAFEADPAGEVALRVEVDEQDALACECERGAEVDGGGGFADAAFLIGDDEDASHFWCLTKPCVCSCESARQDSPLSKAGARVLG
jgi:hypothetical protein